VTGDLLNGVMVEWLAQPTGSLNVVFIFEYCMFSGQGLCCVLLYMLSLMDAFFKHVRHGIFFGRGGLVLEMFILGGFAGGDSYCNNIVVRLEESPSCGIWRLL